MTSTKAKKSAKPATPPSAANGLIVLGFDARQKPCGARFVNAKPALVVKAAQLMGLRVYKVASRDVAAAAKKLPLGQLYANGRAFVPHVRQSLYSDGGTRRLTGENDPLPKSRRPRSRRAIVSAYDHRVGRRDDVMCH